MSKISDLRALSSNIQNSLSECDFICEGLLSNDPTNELFVKNARQIRNILSGIVIEMARLNYQTLKTAKFESVPPKDIDESMEKL